MNTQTIVFAVDDEPSILIWIKGILESIHQPVECYNSPLDFLARVTPEDQGCLVLDVRMPAMNGLQVQEAMAQRGIQLPIIFLSGHGDIPMALLAVRNGAFDFLEKPVHPEVLLERIQSALEHDRRCREEAATRETMQARMKTLTDRERDVLRMVIEGKPNKAIAYDLNISEKTVEYRRKWIMNKLGVNSLAQLVQAVLMLDSNN